MKILFKKPSALSAEKNNALMTQLSDVLAYKGVEEMGTHLLLELDNESIEFDFIKQLFALFKQWGIDQSPLESLLQLVDMKDT